MNHPDMWLRVAVRGVARAIRARRRYFLIVFLGFFALNLVAPPVLLSIFRKPVDGLTVNPFANRLAEYLAGEGPHARGTTLEERLTFVFWSMAWFWTTASALEPDKGFEWGVSVRSSNIYQFVAISTLFAAWFTILGYARAHGGFRSGVRPGGVGGFLVSMLGYSTTGCSVAGCGVPVLPVLGLAFTVGVPTATLAALQAFTQAATPVAIGVFLILVLVAGWLLERPLQASGATDAMVRRLPA